MNAMADRPLDREHPWPGLMSFSERAQEFFHGRDAETGELLRLVKRSPLTVLFGQSGLGKTSLVQAGLFPRLRQQDFLPVYIRLDLANHTLPLVEQVKSAVAEAIAEQRIQARPPAADETLWEYFHREDIDFWTEKNHLVVPVLVFDQFEEIFTLLRSHDSAQDDRRRLVTALAELIENRTPPSVADRLDREPERTADFDFAKQNCRLVLSFREDFLAHFEELRRTIPSIMSNRMRLTRMTGRQALEVVERSGGHLIEPGAARRIIAFVASGREGTEVDLDTLEVEPSLLSVVCQELNTKRIAAGQPLITAGLLAGYHTAIIADFYASSTADIDPRCKRFIEDRLLTEAGHRDSCALEDAVNINGVSREAIDTLISRRLLRLEERFGVLRVELTHDLVTGVIRESRDHRLEQARAAEEKRQQKRRVRRLALIGVAMAAVAVVMLAAAFKFYRQSLIIAEERELLLGHITTMTAELADEIRLVPGSVDVVSYFASDGDDFVESWNAHLRNTGDGDDLRAVNRLKVGNLVVLAGSNIIRGSLSESLKDLAAAEAILDDMASRSPDSGEFSSQRLDLLLQRGQALRLQGKWAEAAADARAALALADRIVAATPDDRRAKRRLSTALNGAGDALLRDKTPGDKGLGDDKIAAADALYQRSRQMAEAGSGGAAELAAADTADSRDRLFWLRQAALGHAKRADVLRAQGKIEEAQAEYQERVRLTRALKMADPVRSRVGVAFAQYQMGQMLLKDGRLPEAAQALGESALTFETLADFDPKNIFWPKLCADVGVARGDLALAQGNPSEAAVQYEEARHTYERLDAIDPTNQAIHDGVTVAAAKRDKVLDAAN